MEKELEKKEQTREQTVHVKEFLIGTFVGGLVGATTALLFAPKSGKDLRNEIQEQKDLLLNKTNQYRELVVEKGSELAAAAKEKTVALTDAVQSQSKDLLNKVKPLRAKNEDTPVQEEVPTEEEVQQKLTETEQELEEVENQ